jgi:hypothetical protein
MATSSFVRACPLSSDVVAFASKSGGCGAGERVADFVADFFLPILEVDVSRTRYRSK